MKKKIAVVGAAAVVLGAGVVAGYLLKPGLPPGIGSVDPAHGNDAKKNVSIEERHASGFGIDLDVFVVNLAGQVPARYLRTTLNLGVESEEEKRELTKFTGPIRHAVIMYLTQKTAEELMHPDGKAKLRAELRKEINAAVGRNLVANVYFNEFLIQ